MRSVNFRKYRAESVYRDMFTLFLPYKDFIYTFSFLYYNVIIVAEGVEP